jgi:hypothetical protein
VTRLHGGRPGDPGRLDGGERLVADRFVSTMPAEVYLPDRRGRDGGAGPDPFSALISVVCATTQEVRPDAYWSPTWPPLDRTAGAIFLLGALNPPSAGRGHLRQFRRTSGDASAANFEGR